MHWLMNCQSIIWVSQFVVFACKFWGLLSFLNTGSENYAVGRIDCLFHLVVNLKYEVLGFRV